MFWKSRSQGAKVRSQRCGRSTPTFRPVVEGLEDRVVPATPTPTLFSGGANTNGLIAVNVSPNVGPATTAAQTAEANFKTAIGGVANTTPTPQSSGFRVITWDGVTLTPTQTVNGVTLTNQVITANTIGIPVNRFQNNGVIFQEVYAVTNDGFVDVNPGVANDFPAFTPNNTFAMFGTNGVVDNQIEQHFVLASGPNQQAIPAAVAGFGAIFLNVTQANTTSIEYFSGTTSLGKFFVPASPNPGQPQFFGALFNSPIVTDVTITLGNANIFFVNNGSPVSGPADKSNGGSANQVDTDDFVFSEPRQLSVGGLTFSAVGTDSGFTPSTVTILNSQGTVMGQFAPFGTGYSGGVRVAEGDVTGDSITDLVVSSGKGGVTAVLVYDGSNILANPSNPTPLFGFNPFGSTFAGGAFVAVGRLDGARNAEIIVGADSGGGPQVNIYSAAQIATRSFTTPAVAFFAYNSNFTGGVRVAATDVNGDGLSDLITGAGKGGGPQVNVYFGANTSVFLQNFGPAQPNPNIAFFGFGPGLSSFTGGIFVVGIDVNGDHQGDILVGADSGGGPEAALFSGSALTAASPNFNPLTTFYALQPSNFTGGVRVGSARILLPSGATTVAFIAGAGPGGGPQVDLFDGQAIFNNPTATPTPFSAFSVPPGTFTSGVFVGGL